MACMKRACDLTGHTDRVWCLAWSPCGSLLTSCGGDRTVRVWSDTLDSSAHTMGSTVPKWKTVQVLDGAHTGTVRSCCWSPDGHYLASASFDKTVVLWEHIHGNDHDDDWESIAVLEGHESEVKGVAWNPNGSLLATCGRDKTVWFWESQPGEDFDVVDVKHGHSQDVKSVVWHPHGELLASVSYDDSVKLWLESEDSEWMCAQTLVSAHASTVWDVAFDKDGRFMATCGDDCTIKLWKIQCSSQGESVECSLLKTLSGLHTRSIYSIDIMNKNGTLYIATGGGDDVIHVISFDPDTEELSVLVQQLHAHSQDVNCVRWRPSRQSDTIGMLASAGDDGVVTLWNVFDHMP